MIIKLTTEYFIEDLDVYNVVLRKTYVSYGSGRNQYEKPQLVAKDLGYYRTVEQALEGYWRLLQRDKANDFNGDIEQYIARLKDIKDDAIKTMSDMAKGGKKNG